MSENKKLHLDFLCEADSIDFESGTLELFQGNYPADADGRTVVPSVSVHHPFTRKAEYQMGKKYRVTIEEVNK